MKKFICLLLAAMVTLVMMSAALAGVEAYYEDGQVTVSTDEEEGFWEITIDGEWIGQWIGGSHPSHTHPMELEDGEHTAAITKGSQSQSAVFMVGEAQPGGGSDEQPVADPDEETEPQPTAAPAVKGPVKLEYAAYATGVLKFRVSGLRSYAELWIDGVNTGLTVKENGEQRLVRLLSEGGHTLALYVPAYDEMDIADFSAADFTPNAEALREILPTLVKNEKGEILGSGLAIDRNETSFLLRVSVDNKPNAILTIGREQLETLLEQGLNVIEYVNGKVSLSIDLTKVTDAWFKTEAPVAAYCFALTAGEDGAHLTVYAATGEGNVEAGVFSGLTLISGGNSTAVKKNGVY